jgi:tetratricopeptide (TPR) repeat protein
MTQSNEDLRQQFETALEAAKEDPKKPEHWDQIEMLAGSLDNPEEVSKAYHDALKGELGAELAVELGDRAIQFHQEWFGEDPAGLESILDRVLELNPGAESAFQKLTMTLTVSQRWEDLFGLYDKTIDSIPSKKKKIQLLEEASQVAKDVANSPNKAIDYLQKLLPLQPEDQQLAQSLERLLEKHERWGDLIGLWTRQLDGQSREQRLATRAQIAECWLEKLSDPARALDAVFGLLDEDEHNDEGLKLLERIIGTEEVAEDVRDRALSRLRLAYEATGRQRDIVRVIESILDAAGEEKKKALHEEAGDRLTELGDATAAMEHYSKLLVMSPTSSVTQEKLHSLAEQAGEHGRYAQDMTAAAEAATDVSRKAELFAEAARTHVEKLNDQASAIELYQRALSQEGITPVEVLSLGRRLRKLLAEQERKEELLDVLERLASVESVPSSRKAMIGDAARLAQELGQTERALAAWNSRLQADPDDVDAINSLVSLLESAERWDELVAALNKRISAPVPDNQKRADLVRIAGIYLEKLEAPERSIETWQRVQDLFGETDETVDYLVKSYDAAGRWNEMVDLLERASEQYTSRVTERLMLLGNACRDHLEAPQRALEAYAKALLHDSKHEGARQGLRGLLEVDACRAEAADALVISYRENEEWKEIVELVEPRIQASDDPRVHLQVLKEAADLEQKELDDKEAAFGYLARAFPLEPSNRVTEDRLIALAEATEQWPAAVEALRKATEALAEDPHARAHLQLREATILEAQIGDNEAAVEAYLRVYALQQDNRTAVEGIVRLGTRLGRWQDVATVTVGHIVAVNDLVTPLLDEMEKVAEEASSFDAMAPAMEKAMSETEGLPPHLGFSIWYRIAKWHRDKREDAGAAEKALLEAVSLDGNRADALRDLAELQRAHPGRPLFDTLRRLADVDPDDLNVIGEAASVAAEHVGDRELTRTTLSAVMGRAAAAWRGTTEAKGAQPPEAFVAWALEQLVGDYLAAEEPAAAVDLLVDASRMPFDEETQLTMRRRAAAIADEEMGDPVTAIEMYRSVLSRVPNDTDTMEKLAVLYEKQERFAELLSLRQHEMKTQSPEQERRLHLRLELSRLVEEVVKRGGRVEALRTNLKESPGHPATIDALSAVLDKEGRYELLYDVLLEQAQELETMARGAEAAELWSRVADIAEHKLGQIDRAVSAHRRVAALSPTEHALDALARLYMARGEPTEAVKWLQQWLEQASAEAKPSVYLRLAKAYLATDEPVEAITTLERARQEEAWSGENRDLLIDLYRKQKRWEPLADLLASSLPDISDEETIVSHAREAADIYNKRLSYPEKAVPALEKALALVPGDRDMQMQLAKGLRVIERSDEARKILEKIIADFGRRRSAERAAAHVELANVAKAEGSIDEALEQLDLASKMAMGNAQIMRMVADVARDAGKLEKAERSYRALLLVVRRQQPGDDEDAVGVSEVLYELHRLAEQGEDGDQAKELYESALDEAMQSNAEVHRLRRTLLAHGRLETLEKAIRKRLEAAKEAEDRAPMLVDLADLLEEQLDRPADALEPLLEAVALAPSRRDLTRRAEKLAVDTEKVGELVLKLTDVAGKLRRKEEAPLAADLWMRVGQIAEEKLGDAGKAAELYEKAEATGHRTGDALFAIARVSAVTGDKEEQNRAFGALKEIAAEGEGTPEQADALYRLAELQVATEDHRQEAIEMVKKALELEPRYRDAARVLQTACDADPQNTDYLQVYEPIAKAAGDWEILLDFLERRAGLPDVTPEQVKEAVDLALAHEQPERAEGLYAKAVDAARNREEGLAGAVWAAVGLIGRKQATGDFQGAFDLLREISEYADPDRLFEVGLGLARAATQAEEADLSLAAEIYEFLRQRRPMEQSVWEPLYEIYEKTEAYDRLQELVSVTLPDLGDIEQRNGLRLRHARLLIEKLEALPEAVELLRDALTDRPESVEATSLMEKALRQQGDTDGLVDFLFQQFEQARSSDNKELIVELVPKLGTLLESMESPDAMSVFRTGLVTAPDNPTMIKLVLDRLDPDEEDNAAERLELMERLLGVSTDEEAALPIGRQVVAIREESEDLEAIRRAYELAHRACPSEEAFTQKLRALYEENELHEPLARMLATDGERTDDPEQAVTLLREAASIYLENLEDVRAAAEVLKKAREAMPKDQMLVSELASCLAAAGDVQGAVDAIGQALEEDLEGAARVHPQLLRAELQAQLGKHQEAVEGLEEAYELDAETVLPHLLAGLEKKRAQAEEAGEVEPERSATLRLAELLSTAGEGEKARAYLAAWVQRQPEDKEALVALRTMSTEASDADGLITACSRLALVERGASQVEAAMTLAKTAREARRPEEARPVLEAVYQAQPESEEIKEQLRAVYEETGAHRELAELLMKDAEATDDEEAKCGLFERVAQIYLNDLGDAAAAVGPVDKLREIRPDDLGTTLLYIDTLLGAGKVDEADEVLQPAIEAHKKPSPDLGALLLRLSKVAAARGDAEEQMKHLKKAFSVARKSGEIAVEVARAAEAAEDHDLALKALRTISLGKKDGPISRAEAFLWEAKIEATRGNRAKALLQLKKALKEDPENEEALQLKEELSNK